MAAAMIPPPIVSSPSQASPSPRALAQSLVIAPDNPLQDRQSELEADLQFLLDAQAEGLVKGLEGGAGLSDDQTSNGSTTPTARSMGSAISQHARRRATRPKPGLRSARKGIYTSMLALSTLKDNEIAEAEEDVHASEDKLSQISEWETKKAGLREATRTLDGDEETVRAQRLRHEAEVLQREISAVELQLADMKGRHRRLVGQLEAVENAVQARLASYTSSLRLLEEDVRKFLTLEESSADVRDGRSPAGGRRRTLELAKQRWTEERGMSMERRQAIGHEKSALDDGAALWKDVVTQVTDFERRLRAEVSKMSGASPLESPAAEDNSQTLAGLLEHMARLMHELESSFDIAQERKWNLLIAAIGAELDALGRGKRLLENLLHPGTGGDQRSEEDTHQPSVDDASAQEILELDNSFDETSRRRLSNGTDSDPDPDLLFSRRDDPDAEHDA